MSLNPINQNLERLVGTNWGIKVEIATDISARGYSKSSIYLLTSTEGERFVLKIYPASFDSKQLFAVGEYLDFLQTHDYPNIAYPVTNFQGNNVVTVGNQLAELTKYIDGDPKFMLTELEAQNLGRSLANFHQILQQFPEEKIYTRDKPLHEVVSKKRFDWWNERTSETEALLRQWNCWDLAAKFYSLGDQIWNNYLSTIDWQELDRQFTYSIVHRDFSRQNILFVSEVPYFIDFAGLSRGRVMDDLARAIVESEDESTRETIKKVILK